MRGYSDITRSTSACVHFVDSVEISDDLAEIKRTLGELSIDVAYVDCSRFNGNFENLSSVIAERTKSLNSPYSSESWVRMLDDLISASKKMHGIVIVLDNASLLLKQDPRRMFDLIESFLIQFHHWFGIKKPCHLCFQMTEDARVGAAFAHGRIQS